MYQSTADWQAIHLILEMHHNLKIKNSKVIIIDLSDLLIVMKAFWAQQMLFNDGSSMIFNEGNLLQTNHYSYTEPSYFFGNHHWGVGVIYYLVQKINGFIMDLL